MIISIHPSLYMTGEIHQSIDRFFACVHILFIIHHNNFQANHSDCHPRLSMVHIPVPSFDKVQACVRVVFGGFCCCCLVLPLLLIDCYRLTIHSKGKARHGMKKKCDVMTGSLRRQVSHIFSQAFQWHGWLVCIYFPLPASALHMTAGNLRLPEVGEENTLTTCCHSRGVWGICVCACVCVGVRIVRKPTDEVANHATNVKKLPYFSLTPDLMWPHTPLPPYSPPWVAGQDPPPRSSPPRRNQCPFTVSYTVIFRKVPDYECGLLCSSTTFPPRKHAFRVTSELSVAGKSSVPDVLFTFFFFKCKCCHVTYYYLFLSGTSSLSAW